MRLTSLILVLLPLSVTAAPVSWSSVEGNWQVVSVAVKAQPGQTYIARDPLFMGARLAFRPDGITWLRGTSERSINPATDNCRNKPRLTAANGSQQDADFRFKYGFNVMCGKNAWGPAPGAVLSILADGNARLFWDGAQLSLRRIK